MEENPRFRGGADRPPWMRPIGFARPRGSCTGQNALVGAVNLGRPKSFPHSHHSGHSDPQKNRGPAGNRFAASFPAPGLELGGGGQNVCAQRGRWVRRILCRGDRHGDGRERHRRTQELDSIRHPEGSAAPRERRNHGTKQACTGLDSQGRRRRIEDPHRGRPYRQRTNRAVKPCPRHATGDYLLEDRGGRLLRARCFAPDEENARKHLAIWAKYSDTDSGIHENGAHLPGRRKRRKARWF